MSKRSKKYSKIAKTRKQKLWKMKGCSRKNRKSVNTSLDKLIKQSSNNKMHFKDCNCLLCNKNKKISKGGSGCGLANACPIAPFPMNGGINGGMNGGMNGEMNGGHCGSCGQNLSPLHNNGILGIGQNGGNATCGITCGQQINQRAGGFYKPPVPMPGPFIGQPWKPTVGDWPGVDGISSNRNYLENNLYHQDPQTMMKLEGGKGKRKTHKNRRILKAGGLIPQDLVNLGRDITFGFGSAYNALNGYPAPVNPLPYKDQLPNASARII